jgi:hypothetical protein
MMSPSDEAAQVVRIEGRIDRVINRYDQKMLSYGLRKARGSASISSSLVVGVSASLMPPAALW